MDLDELERRTHEQIRALQEEYQKRLEPLHKILVDIHMARPLRLTIPMTAPLFGASSISGPAYSEGESDTGDFVPVAEYMSGGPLVESARGVDEIGSVHQWPMRKRRRPSFTKARSSRGFQKGSGE